MNPIKTVCCWLVAFSGVLLSVHAQNLNKYGYPLAVISDVQVYRQLVAADTNKALVEIKDYIPNIVLDVRYATSNNFLGKVFYQEAKSFARLPVVRALQQIQKELNAQGLGLKIYDGYRPYAVTVQFYQSHPDSTYVASPWTGSKHNRGCALDLTVVNLKTGKELKMPTPFDTTEKESWADAPVK
ncbi:MAG: M15 family metallopeptidase, partial [Saprospiraceae bacterium]